MLPQKKVRDEAILDVTVGRELLEDELAAICGGHASVSSPDSTGLGDSSGLSTLTNLLNGQKATNAKDNTLFNANKIGGLPDFGSLSNLTGGLLGKFF